MKNQILFFFIIFFFDFGIFANINITSCSGLENITSSNNYLLVQDLDCASFSGSIVFMDGIFGKIISFFAEIIIYLYILYIL